MALWKRNKRYWTRFVVNGIKFRKPLCQPGHSLATTNWKEAVQLERDVIEQARNGSLTPTAGPGRLFAAFEGYLTAKRTTANRERTVTFDEERITILKDRFGDALLSTITRESIEGFQARRKLEGVANRTINMDVGTLRKVLKRYGHWRRLQDHVHMLSEKEGPPIGRALTHEEQKRLLETAQGNPEWEHVYCAAVLAANTSMRGVEVKHIRRKNVDLEKAWDAAEGVVTGRGVLYVGHSKNESSQRQLPLNGAARDALARMLRRADELGHTDPDHYLWCASPHFKYDPTKPAKKWRSAWHSLRDAAGLPGLRFHDLRHTVVTDLLEAGEPEHVIQAVTGQLSKKMLEHYSHQRLKAKGQMLTRMEERRRKETA